MEEMVELIFWNDFCCNPVILMKMIFADSAPSKRGL
jgi:hypothetical protein